MPQTPIPFDDVEVISDTGLGFFCRIAGKEVFVGSALPMKGTTLVPVPGDRGRLVIPRWFAEQSGLPIPPTVT